MAMRASGPAAAWRPPSSARVGRVRARLREVYGVPSMAPHRHPLAELVLTVLSQSTNDRNRDIAYLRLRERLPRWEQVRDAPVAEVEEAIRPGGISKVKSVRIQAILQAITAEPVGRFGDASAAGVPRFGRFGDASAAGVSRSGRFGDASAAGVPRLSPAHRLCLDWMATAPLGEARDYLLALPGVGRKTAACVLLFAFGRRDVPVDTHVSRVGMRLALLRAGAPFEELHDAMLALTPPGSELELHVNLLRHGRRTCHARRPRCEACALARMCPSRGLFA
ncbi:MAG TPA: DNA lyase [Solirubrobacteraceae bacterium]|jgi:endonuclease-3|nr:DNA lyase [Solirubrobacteraceae bacterium]